MTYFFIILGFASLLGILAISWRQLAFVRANNLTNLSVEEEYLGELFQHRVDLFYERFHLFFRHFIHYLSLYTLLSLRRLVIIGRFVLTRVERKFSHLIDAVHGRNALLRRGGPVSPFLAQLKEPKQ